ncbi:Cell division protein FtsK [Pseudonocardia sp. Ae168_Ps1]|uniref:FtsK/SpoIIIE domain-containing protein n=1 Tax=unclassified Pseudonocardia TaxID=2619320 RepID=UPI00094B70CD|nr:MULTISPECIES: FtsK/SpoIIIE domain-containing protein [unclassified Pseudonocardia]OLL82354.1 Cell division protein FtsK [Pseudonocardia sp. Ae168_Ps1]OLL83530.1 Cell division protein FtsK [Pseudonocardia sp. Ae263_Ps1]OLL90431.1 Cell division protein FtsK [Pseudonocardia sp. Ae356_Ps1]
MSEHPPTQPLPLITTDEEAPARLVRPLLVLRRWADEYRAHRHERRTDEGPSIWEPIHLGTGEDGRPVRVPLIYRNMLLAGEPGAGKSVGLNNIVAHAALATDCRLWLFDGKIVELGLWRSCADRFVANSLDDAIAALLDLQSEMDQRYAVLDDERRRKIAPADEVPPIVVVLDELAYFSATVGTKREQEAFSVLVRDLVARGRAAGIIVVAATQRPSSDIIPTSLRDLFGYRWAFRCTTDASSDIVLGHGWAARGHSAASVAPETKGIGFLLAEGGVPRRIKAAHLSDEQVYALADRAAMRRLAAGIAHGQDLDDATGGAA